MENLPGMISLLAGKPNPDAFPINSVSFTTRHPSGDEVQLSLNGPALHEAMQYTMIQGLPALLEWVTSLQEMVHGRKPEEGWSISMGVGSADLIHKVNLFLYRVLLSNSFSASMDCLILETLF
jgi:tryptophan aminotransferase